MRYLNTSYRTENHQWVQPVVGNRVAALQVDLNEVQVALFASKEQDTMQLCCSRYFKTAYRFYWRSMGGTMVLTKNALEGARVVLCTPDWGTTGDHAHWGRLLDCMTVERTQLADRLIYVPE